MRLGSAGAIAALTLVALPALAQDLPPSGHVAELFDIVVEPEADLVRFRFVLPALAAGVGHDEVGGDLPWLCETVALPELDANGWSFGTVVISLSDRALALGEVDPDTVQFFEAFRVSDGTCILEVF